MEGAILDVVVCSGAFAVDLVDVDAVAAWSVVLPDFCDDSPSEVPPYLGLSDHCFGSAAWSCESVVKVLSASNANSECFGTSMLPALPVVVTSLDAGRLLDVSADASIGEAVLSGASLPETLCSTDVAWVNSLDAVDDIIDFSPFVGYGSCHRVFSFC